MRDIFILFLHGIFTIIRLGQPGGLRSVVVESVLMRHQILILNRGRKSQPSSVSSHHRWFVHPLHASGSCFAVGDRFKDLHSAASPQNAGQAEVPAAVFIETSPPAGSQRADETVDRCGCRNETAQSHLGLQANCSADRPGHSVWKTGYETNCLVVPTLPRLDYVPERQFAACGTLDGEIVQGCYDSPGALRQLTGRTAHASGQFGCSVSSPAPGVRREQNSGRTTC